MIEILNILANNQGKTMLRFNDAVCDLKGK